MSILYISARRPKGAFRRSNEGYWAALSLSFHRISIILFMNIIAWGPQVSHNVIQLFSNSYFNKILCRVNYSFNQMITISVELLSLENCWFMLNVVGRRANYHSCFAEQRSRWVDIVSQSMYII